MSGLHFLGKASPDRRSSSTMRGRRRTCPRERCSGPGQPALFVDDQGNAIPVPAEALQWQEKDKTKDAPAALFVDGDGNTTPVPAGALQWKDKDGNAVPDGG